ncbi:aminotransferase class I/II-fold pyridoxal phosphate-dependent enzyme [uncultured Bifidobacterium sp.]|uniref:trans-sulfuration enzyme family protein n=1 Tax=uncultured Bifidobacterium sp. TaxID=165187 RepID=UPI002628DD54|nr:aminotransferase class I/II-fold pyridoxal phosphate-dependent enzyme [uncultured Bifidobacterium sp.]
MTRFATQLVHGTPVGDNNTGAVNPPIYNSSTYAFQSVDDAPRWDYARSGNPTRDFLERQIAQLEHGTRGFAFSSGLAAIHAVLSIFTPGDRVVVGSNVYGGTYSLFNEHFSRWGLTSEPVDTGDYEAVERAIAGTPEDGTSQGAVVRPAKAVYFETLTNPLLEVNDVAAIAAIAHRYGALVIVDNTFVTPYLQQPLDLGADIVIHSATKYLAGHSDVIAGLAVVGDDDLGKRVYFAQNRLGGVLAPAECDSVRRGIQTLGLRIERQQSNAVAIANWLLTNPLVAAVHYPGVAGGGRPGDTEKGLKGFGGVLSFEVVKGVDPAQILNNLHVFRLAVSLGAVESLAELPCRMTHFELPREERLKVGVTDELIRLAIGIEDVRDLIEDLEQAFAIAAKAADPEYATAFVQSARFADAVGTRV